MRLALSVQRLLLLSSVILSIFIYRIVTTSQVCQVYSFTNNRDVFAIRILIGMMVGVFIVCPTAALGGG
jgi:hypothetical protein